MTLLFYLLLIIILLIILFLIINSIIWLKNKKITNINDIIIEYIIYGNFIFIISSLVYLSYYYIYK